MTHGIRIVAPLGRPGWFQDFACWSCDEDRDFGPPWLTGIGTTKKPGTLFMTLVLSVVWAHKQVSRCY